MWKKVMNLFNWKSWIENVIYKKVMQKGIKGAVSVVIGLLGSAFFTVKVKPVLDQMGIQLDEAQLQVGLTVLFTGLFQSLFNMLKHVMDEKK